MQAVQAYSDSLSNSSRMLDPASSANLNSNNNNSSSNRHQVCGASLRSNSLSRDNSNSSQAQTIQQQREGLPQLRQSSAQPFAAGSVSGHREKSVVEQIRVLNDKWDPQNPNCVFQHYFYNSVKPEEAPFYGPSPGEDERKWEEALSNKPSAGAIPVLARGFEQVAERIRQQSAAVTALRTRLHEINNSLTLLKDQHELNVASRITEAKRKHIVFTQRTLALATKVQILRNRGYVMDQQEEELKKKLVELEKQTFDPVLGDLGAHVWRTRAGADATGGDGEGRQVN
jgi:nuclear pore complex protein Nup54